MLLDSDRRAVCTKCGMIGADVRPHPYYGYPLHYSDGPVSLFENPTYRLFNINGMWESSSFHPK